MVDFLTDPAHAAKGQAWADVHGLEVDEIAGFIEALTPVRLRFDTRVTNHGFVRRRGTELQSVLKAGTAVLSTPGACLGPSAPAATPCSHPRAGER